ALGGFAIAEKAERRQDRNESPMRPTPECDSGARRQVAESDGAPSRKTPQSLRRAWTIPDRSSGRGRWGASRESALDEKPGMPADRHYPPPAWEHWRRGSPLSPAMAPDTRVLRRRRASAPDVPGSGARPEIRAGFPRAPDAPPGRRASPTDEPSRPSPATQATWPG